uniref:Uncharacterized protein n=1 Tax=Rhizochromulina marina TaxID=1034831 RepID=A0A7S2SUA3_9STRA|mmetsp:Transcript_6225/g.18157  ORF Transcript_6225/g.18157 Transcript_6225/m.18157 type:complete len:118 (+) Transcript_6225:82-435(+)|eukprot:CAMPEP_0118963224 /NCGR_PEP_ID=MMETSP1173-20130426/1224_1 /TAXON_ID=1034831 /ORGANISM="Rhizochromulina marina cf, Strain CCMP1243" /LENGTH=117 /DNA_ID=CAMNT_0006911543 /DNA_START=28 /DNA_END=381 /DNA_ORIENTATION=+
MGLRALLLVALVGLAAAFTPSQPLKAAVRSTSTTLSMGYIPDGLSQAEYDKLKKKEQSAAQERKKKFKFNGFEDLTDWVRARDKKFPNQPGKGHTFAKVKGDEKGKVPFRGALKDKK